MYDTTPPDVKAVALAVYHESRGEPLQCQVLVAGVVKKRMEVRGKTAHQVVAEPGQFTWYGKAKVIKEKGAYQQSVAVAKRVLAAPDVADYQFFKVGKRGGYRCGAHVFSVAYNSHR